MLQISVLNLFVQFKARFPNMVVGEITRRKMRNALEKGITADQVRNPLMMSSLLLRSSKVPAVILLCYRLLTCQIIAYLTVHAHPQMHKNNPLLPVTVQDQLRLYETELHRVVHSPAGHLYADFSSIQEYTMALAYAKQLDVVLWDSGEAVKGAGGGGSFFVTAEGHGAIKGYVAGLEAEINGGGQGGDGYS